MSKATKLISEEAQELPSVEPLKVETPSVSPVEPQHFIKPDHVGLTKEGLPGLTQVHKSMRPFFETQGFSIIEPTTVKKKSSTAQK